MKRNALFKKVKKSQKNSGMKSYSFFDEPDIRNLYDGADLELLQKLIEENEPQLISQRLFIKNYVEQQTLLTCGPFIQPELVDLEKKEQEIEDDQVIVHKRKRNVVQSMKPKSQESVHSRKKNSKK